MWVQPSRRFILGLAAGLLCLSAPLLGQANSPRQPQCKDQQECDLYNAALKDNNAQTRLQKLQQWQKQYPATDFARERRNLLLTAYVAAGQPKEAVAVARQTLAEDPQDFTALYYTVLLTRQLYGASPQPAVLDDGEQAATAVLARLDTPPAGVAPDQWAKLRPDIEILSHVTLGFVGMQRKNWDGAESELKKALAVNPTNSEVDYMLGFTLASKKQNSAALFYYARAASYDGPAGSLSAQSRQGVWTELQKMYTVHHGSLDGLNDLLAAAKAQPNPPDGFHIQSKGEIARAAAEEQQKKEEEIAKANPELTLWKNMKAQLTGAEGASYFDSGVKGAQLPTLKGKVVKLEPDPRPKTVVLAIEDGVTPDATLKFEMPLPGKVDAGTELAFEGVPESYTASPFMIVFNVEKEKLQGWTGKNAPVHRPAVKK
jgi:outer membrane protein assembly factor BamD (BamD/ComL family)